MKSRQRTTRKRRGQGNGNQRKGQLTTIRSGGLVEASNGIAASIKMVLTYEDLITISENAPRTQYTFRGNSVYDPDYTSTGHQPRYFDTYASIYGKYRVYASRIMIDMINGSPTSGVSFVILPHTDIVTMTTWHELAELPMAKVGQIVPIASRYAQRLTHASTTAQTCGLRPKEVLDQDWASGVGNNPVQLWYWNLGIASIDSTTDIGISFRVRLEYEVVFFDRNDPGVSVFRSPETPSDQQRALPNQQCTSPNNMNWSDEAEQGDQFSSTGGVCGQRNSTRSVAPASSTAKDRGGKCRK